MANEPMKLCTKCKAEKPLDQFNKDKGKPTGLASWCRPCKKRSNNSYHAYYRRHNSPKKTPENVIREMSLRRRGITKDQYEEMFLEQNGKCAICFQKSQENLHIDHCHSTNRIRGLLCRKCNLGLGLFQDSTDNLLRAIDYLEMVNAGQ